MKKSVIIGSLVAGAFLLPALASAGVATGRCDKCHTMHASQDGATSTPNSQLLIGSGCIGCHTGGGANGATGKGGPKNAPQVDDASGWNGTSLAGGFFTTGADWDGQHNVTNLTNIDTAITANDIPGNDQSMSAVSDAGNTRIACEDCHRAAGHHTDAGYRMLEYGVTAVVGTPPANYGVSINRGAAAYDGATMNAFCDSCHPDFHSATIGVGTNIGSYGSWIRHPVNIGLTAADAAHGKTGIDYTVSYDNAGGDYLSVTPTGDGATQTVMCLSCHLAHGGAEADILAFTYGLQNAGNNAREAGCENCHNYGVAAGY